MDVEQQDRDMATVRDLEQAVACIFQNNFDADTRVCLTTLMRMLDNLLHQPTNAKVRTIRLQNETFHRKVGSRVGAISFLEACGFVRQTPSAPLLSGGGGGVSLAPMDTTTTSGGSNDLLVLSPEREDQSHLIVARRLLMTRAIQDLGMKADQLPTYRPPPPPVTITSTNAGNNNSNNNTFNPYAGHRFDGQSAAVGTNLGPDANYVSPTETQLQRLQQQQAALEAQLHHTNNQPNATATKAPKPDRGWSAWGPHQTIPVAAAAATNSAAAAATASNKSDSSLLAERMKKQQEERLKRENGGFTTKAMRDLEKLQKQKVYSHVSLTIQFPDGYKLLGKFFPKDTISTVKKALLADCLVVNAQQQQQQRQNQLFDLYMTPPRRLLPERSTLQAEGLVPAAKIFVSWKAGAPPAPAAAAAASSAGKTASYLQPSLFAAAAGKDDVSYFPTGQSIAAAAANQKDSQSKKAKTAGSAAAGGTSNSTQDSDAREAALLRRMMGGGKGGGGGLLGGGGKKKKDSNKPSSSGSNKPKWFK